VDTDLPARRVLHHRSRRGGGAARRGCLLAVLAHPPQSAATSRSTGRPTEAAAPPTLTQTGGPRRLSQIPRVSGQIVHAAPRSKRARAEAVGSAATQLGPEGRSPPLSLPALTPFTGRISPSHPSGGGDANRPNRRRPSHPSGGGDANHPNRRRPHRPSRGGGDRADPNHDQKSCPSLRR